jgi:thiol-disulfide isomerase/thioredoxin
MMFVSIGIGTVLAVALIAVMSVLTGGKVTTTTGLTSALTGHHVKSFSLSSVNEAHAVSAPWASGHPTVLIFFASWCGPCQEEMPKVSTYVRTHNLGAVRVLGMDANDELSAAKHFLATSGTTFPVAFDANGTVTSTEFDFQQLPETVFISGSGVVRSVYFGAVPVARLRSGIAALG